MQTECLVEGGPEAVVEGCVRFLHLLNREVGRLDEPVAALPAGHEPPITAVASLDVGDQRFHAWQEAVERTVAIPETAIGQLTSGALTVPFAFAGERALEPLRDTEGLVRGVLIRTSAAVAGEIDHGRQHRGVWCVPAHRADRERDARRAPGSARSRGADASGIRLDAHDPRHPWRRFVSLLDPPEDLAKAAEHLRQSGTWPVLAGEEGARDMVLSSPIILYDYPQVAPESPGDLFDATEIDEILTPAHPRHDRRGEARHGGRGRARPRAAARAPRR